MKKQLITNIIMITLSLMIAGVSIWLPGFLLERETRASIGTVRDVPPQYYSGPSNAIIKNASAQLTSEQRIQLITGTWSSDISKVSPEDCNISEFGIKTLALTRIKELYAKGLYPKTLESEKDEWFAWSATPYRALDTTFKTYAAFFWDITFIKYDNTELHRFIITESGDILYAEATMNGEDDLKEFYPKLLNCSYLMYYYGEYTSTTYNTGAIRILTHDNITTTFRTSSPTDAVIKKLDTNNASSYIPNYKNFKPDGVYTLSQSTNNSSDENVFYIPYAKTDTSYQIALIP